MYDPHWKSYADEGSTWRWWIVTRRPDKTEPCENYGRFGHLEVIEKTEKKWEKWIKRLAKVKGEAYVEPLTREEKRRAWIEAKAWLGQYHG